MYEPRPTIVFGQFALCEPVVGTDGIARLSAKDATLLDAATITWGRRSAWEQPEPATLAFEFFDPTTYYAATNWAQKITTQTAVGVGVRMSITLPQGATVAEAPSGEFTLFQGLTTKVTATRTRALTVNGYRDGWRVKVIAGDRTASLGNVAFTWEDWGAERMIDRAIRIRDRAAPTGIRQFYYDADHKDGAVWPLEVRDKNGLDMVHDLYASFGHQWTYHPNRNVVIRIPEHYFPDLPRMVSDPSGVVHIGMPGLTDWTGTEDAIDRAPHAGTWVDACTVSSDVELSTDQMTHITRVECKWHNKWDNGRVIVTYGMKNGATPPYRTLSFDSWFSDGVDIDPIHQRAATKAYYAQSGPHHPPITLRTKATGGFANVSQALWWLTPAERRGYAFLSGSPWFADLYIRPLVTPCGGTITYRAGHWDITANLLRAFSEGAGVALPWQDSGDTKGIPASITWDGTSPALRYASGVSWSDLWWVQSATVIPEGVTS